MNRAFIRYLLYVLCVVLGVGMLSSCSSKKRPSAQTDAVDEWKLISTDPNEEHGTYLGNGFISARIMGEGIGFSDGEALDCYMAGLYIDEKFTAIPTWSDVQFYDAQTPFVLDKSAKYTQTLNMKSGILTTEGTWKAGGKALKGKIFIVISRDKKGMAMVGAQLTPNFNSDISIQHRFGKSELIKLSTQSIDEKTPLSTWEFGGTIGPKFVSCASQFTLYRDIQSTPAPQQVDQQTTAITVQAQKGQPLDVAVWISWARESTAETAQESSLRELNLCLSADSSQTGIEEQFIAQHEAAWEKIWEKDIVIEGDKKAQQTIHSFMFYLLQSVREGSSDSIAPMGLSNNSFNGHIFWDADIWMFPALILQHPQLARSITEYRYRTMPGALKNAVEAGVKGAQFAWESGESGIEDAPKGIAYVNERHINSDVALAQWQYYLATLDKEWLRTRGYPVISASAEFWKSRVKFVNGRYEILQIVAPDENAGLVDNSVYTNVGAKLNLLIAIEAAKILGAPVDPMWQKVADGMYIPFDAENNRYIARDAYTDQILKQADPELVIYPLQVFHKGVDERTLSQNVYDYYVPKINVNGPAMSSSVHSVIAARLGNAEQAMEKYIASYQPFLRGSFNYFNEKRSPTYINDCFLTGAAGPIQALIFGMVGARMDYFDIKPLEFKPCLPKNWTSITLKGVEWQGKTFDVKVDSSGSHITQR